MYSLWQWRWWPAWRWCRTFCCAQESARNTSCTFCLWHIKSAILITCCKKILFNRFRSTSIIFEIKVQPSKLRWKLEILPLASLDSPSRHQGTLLLMHATIKHFQRTDWGFKNTIWSKKKLFVRWRWWKTVSSTCTVYAKMHFYNAWQEILWVLIFCYFCNFLSIVIPQNLLTHKSIPCKHLNNMHFWYTQPKYHYSKFIPAKQLTS